MQHIFYTNHTEAARNTQTLGGKPMTFSFSHFGFKCGSVFLIAPFPDITYLYLSMISSAVANNNQHQPILLPLPAVRQVRTRTGKTTALNITSYEGRSESSVIGVITLLIDMIRCCITLGFKGIHFSFIMMPKY